ncbi:hypothetical protein L0152_19945 [bacterium]|nr:hypothetical protein [bacterium]
MGDIESREDRQSILLNNIKAKLPELQALLAEVMDKWCYEDMIYRFYHHSFKVYWIQQTTQGIVQMLQSLAPAGTTLNRDFLEIINAGASGKQFQAQHNANWTENTRIFLEAFFHAKFFLEMSVKYGKKLERAPELLPSGWAALLYLFDIR